MDKLKLSRMRSLQEKINKTKKEILPLEDELYTLRDEKIKEELSKYIGKCYKYKNSYQNEKPWWLYIKVIGVEHNYLKTIECEKDCYGKIEIRKYQTSTSTLEKKIYEKTFNKMLDKYIKELK